MIIELFDNGFDQIIFTGVFTLYLETFHPGLPTDIIALIMNSIIYLTGWSARILRRAWPRRKSPRRHPPWNDWAERDRVHWWITDCDLRWPERPLPHTLWPKVERLPVPRARLHHCREAQEEEDAARAQQQPATASTGFLNSRSRTERVGIVAATRKRRSTPIYLLMLGVVAWWVLLAQVTCWGAIGGTCCVVEDSS